MALKPLRDVILAIQMNSKFLPDFVKTELCRDFGATNCLKVWQLIMSWRNERKEDIVVVFDSVFKNWKPSAAEGNAPLVDISYIQKVKSASIVKQ